jgi:hypothetical protein
MSAKGTRGKWSIERALLILTEELQKRVYKGKEDTVALK